MSPESGISVDQSLLSSGRDLRMRYIPRARIRPVYLQAAPWLDLLFILFYLVLSQSRIVLRPGVVVDLPAHEAMGVQSQISAVLVPDPQPGQTGATVYFADEAFRLDDAIRLERLGFALADARAAEASSGVLTLYADQRVAQEYVMRVLDLASRAGYVQLNMGTAPFPRRQTK